MKSVCPICGDTRFRDLFFCTDHFLTGESFPILQCTGCHFRITGITPAEKDADRYYQSEAYVSHSDIRKGLVNRAYHLARKWMLRYKLKIVIRGSGCKTGSILDVGAGTGYFLRTMEDHGWQVTGTEKSSHARDFAADHLQLKVFPSEDFHTLPHRSFDVITLWHVMEHLYGLDAYWTGLARLLKPSGHLIIALPNPESADARHYRENWAAWDVPRHLWHFTPGDVKKMAEKYGFSLIKMRRLPLDAFYISILSEKYRASRFPVLKGFFFGKLSFLKSLVNRRHCSSLVYILKFRSDVPS